MYNCYEKKISPQEQCGSSARPRRRSGTAPHPSRRYHSRSRTFSTPRRRPNTPSRTCTRSSATNSAQARPLEQAAARSTMSVRTDEASAGQRRSARRRFWKVPSEAIPRGLWAAAARLLSASALGGLGGRNCTAGSVPYEPRPIPKRRGTPVSSTPFWSRLPRAGARRPERGGLRREERRVAELGPDAAAGCGVVRAAARLSRGLGRRDG
jgi:hypothetical protein